MLNEHDVLSSWIIPKQQTLPKISSRKDIVDRLYYGSEPFPIKAKASVPQKFPWSLSEQSVADVLSRLPSVENVVIIEVGTFWGTTAIELAKAVNGSIICVDQWLGDVEMWSNPDWVKQLRGKEPRYYHEFVANVFANACQDKIVPLRLTSLQAARVLKHRCIECDAVYIDGSHDYLDVLLDLYAYWSLLKTGGLMFGDDYHLPDVKRAVDEFATEHNITVDFFEGKTRAETTQLFWVAQKTYSD